ncbi:hypothetical protein PBT90_15660 [Algoriphagus halophytocola]|uniref:Tryptophan-rich sensory protein n=1 Tax=Algoriphagus halophytocola TaxID=2991499 RepID=A0ABY6MBM1_9BACT|nr:MULTISPECIES: hypothetical protein [unclassified Algoriphagus]UZD21008.1 hypothetical protein OM944_09995 [Algoriphagus sp. TR-M5]WBL42174.1 hypothetical protein PBT90_15660 [Algoriphagus sp. TR-M9]
MKKSHKIYSILNLIVLMAVIFWNYWVNTQGLNGNTVSSLSSEYENLFTPAGYAFSIWGLIFIALFAQAIFFISRAFSSSRDSDFLSQIGPYLIMANIGNGLWLYMWLMEYTGISVIVMLGILSSLVIVILNTNMERWHAPRPIIFWLWWPIALYSGWIAVATIANISAYLVKNNWGNSETEVTWTVIMITIAVLLNLFMIFTRNLREFACVGIWALVAIAVRHWGSLPVVQWTALGGAVVLFVATSYHGYKNRATAPFKFNQTN